MINQTSHRAGSQVLRLSTLAALAYALLVLHACSDTTFVQPPPPTVCDTTSATGALLPPGSYYLANIDGAGLPILVDTRTKVLDSGRIDITADSSFSIVQFLRAPGAGPQGAVTDSTSVSGTFSRCGTDMIFHTRSASPDTYHGSVHQHAVVLAVPLSLVKIENVHGLPTLAFADDPHAYQCGVDNSIPNTVLGSYSLKSANGNAPPVTLPVSYPYAYTLTAATMTLATANYDITAHGTLGVSDTTVVLVSDSGTVVPCQGALRFTSTIRDTSFVVTISAEQLSLNLPDSFVDFYYDFLSPGPIALVFQRDP